MHPRLRKIRLLRRLRRLRRSLKEERGTQLVELAIVLPVFLLMFAATAEFGRYFYEYTTLAKAARVGARYLVTAKVDATQDAIAKNLVIYGNQSGTGSPVISGLTPANVVITRAGGVPTVPQTVTVQIVGFKHQSIFNPGAFVNNSALSLDVDVKPSITMRHLLTTPLI